MWPNVQKSIEFKHEDHYEVIYFVTADDKPYIMESIGHIHATLFFDKYTNLRSGRVYFTGPHLRINSFSVNEIFRGQGLGTKILKYAINDARQYQAKNITLDDMSDNHRQKRNIYVNNGFYYLEDWGPEMQLDL